MGDYDSFFVDYRKSLYDVPAKFDRKVLAEYKLERDRFTRERIMEASRTAFAKEQSDDFNTAMAMAIMATAAPDKGAFTGNAFKKAFQAMIERRRPVGMLMMEESLFREIRGEVAPTFEELVEEITYAGERNDQPAFEYYFERACMCERQYAQMREMVFLRNAEIYLDAAIFAEMGGQPDIGGMSWER